MTSALLQPATSPAQLLFPDLASELATTRRMLARFPDGESEWKPHGKSMSIGQLATHLAELPSFGAMILGTDDLDWATYGYTPRQFTTAAEILALFDTEAASMTAAAESATWEDMDRTWVMRMGDQKILEGRKGMLLRTLGLSHMAHHRGQLGVYLRLLDVSVPSVYGPTADEQGPA